MMQPVRRAAVLVALLLSLGLAAGCGGGDSSSSDTTPAAEDTTATAETTEDNGEDTTEGDHAATADGEEVFASAGCGGCHTLAAAGTSGTVGPDLDSLGPTTEQVVAQVTNGGGGMPAFADDLSTEEILAVAEYVSTSAGS
jgi:mono/diheme cytochrome c family protein